MYTGTGLWGDTRPPLSPPPPSGAAIRPSPQRHCLMKQLPEIELPLLALRSSCSVPAMLPARSAFHTLAWLATIVPSPPPLFFFFCHSYISAIASIPPLGLVFLNWPVQNLRTAVRVLIVLRHSKHKVTHLVCITGFRDAHSL